MSKKSPFPGVSRLSQRGGALLRGLGRDLGYLFTLAAWTKFLWSRFQGYTELIQTLSSVPFSLKLQIKHQTRSQIQAIWKQMWPLLQSITFPKQREGLTSSLAAMDCMQPGVGVLAGKRENEGQVSTAPLILCDFEQIGFPLWA